jgi:iron(III) transport system substrate-binding protein
MKYVKKIAGSLALALSACLFLSPAAHAESTFYKTAKQEGKVVLYTSFSNSDTRVLKEVFDKRFPGVTLEVYRSGGPKILQKILAEHLAGSDIADVVMTKGDAIHLLVQKQLLTKFDSPERQAYEDHFKDPDALWTDVYPTVHSIAYNTSMVSGQDVPRHYTDLLKPQWKGKVGLNTNNFMFLYAMLHLNGKEKGMEFLKKLAAQNPQVRTGGTLTATLTAAGEFPLAVSINANNIENVKEKGGPVDWARLEDPAYADLHPAAVMAKAPHPNAARLFIEFALSREGQTLIKDRGRIPARKDVQPKIAIDRSKLRIIAPEEGAKTKYYQGMLDDLFIKAR